MPELFGHMLENFVATELQKTLSYGKTQGTLFHFRTSDGKKIDFVIEFSDGMLFAIEIKRSGSVGSHDFASLKLLAKETGKKFIAGACCITEKKPCLLVITFGLFRCIFSGNSTMHPSIWRLVL
jgi:uncharacterized protein